MPSLKLRKTNALLVRKNVRCRTETAKPGIRRLLRARELMVYVSNAQHRSHDHIVIIAHPVARMSERPGSSFSDVKLCCYDALQKAQQLLFQRKRAELRDTFSLI